MQPLSMPRWLRSALIACVAVCATAGSTAAAVPNRLVSNRTSSTVFRFDAGGAWQRTYSVAAKPWFMAASPDGRFVVTTSNEGSGNGIAIIDLTTNQVHDHAVAGGQLGNPVVTSDSRYAIIGQINGSGNVLFQRVDLASPASAPVAVTSAGYVNCGQPALAIRQVSATDEIILACSRPNTTTGTYDVVRYSGFDQSTFAMNAISTNWTLPSGAVASTVSGTRAYFALQEDVASTTRLASIDLTNASAAPVPMYSTAGGYTCWSLVVDQAAGFLYGACAQSNSTAHVVRSPLAGGTNVLNPVDGFNPVGIALVPGGASVELAVPGSGFNGGTTLNAWATPTLGNATTGTPISSTPSFDGPTAVVYADVAAAPAAPTPGAVTPGDGSLSIAFTPGSDNGSPITNYEYSLDGGAWTAFSPATTASPVTIGSLTNGTTYAVRLRAVNAGGPGPASVAVTGTPSAAPTPSPDPSPPADPGTQGQSQVTPTPAPVPAWTPTLTFASRTFASTQVRSVTLTTNVRVNGAGRVAQVGRSAATATSRRSSRARTAGATRAPVLCTARRTVPRAGTYRITCTLGRAARAQLTRRALRVRLATVFIATDGQRVTRISSVRVKRLPAPRLPVTG